MSLALSQKIVLRTPPPLSSRKAYLMHHVAALSFDFATISLALSHLSTSFSHFMMHAMSGSAASG